MSKDDPNLTDSTTSDVEVLLAKGVQPKRKGKWRRRLVWTIVLFPFILVATVFIVGQTPMMKWIVEPILEDQLGVDVVTGSVRMTPSGQIVIVDALFQTDSIQGRAGSLIELDKAVISVNWRGIVTGSNPIRSITIDRPLVRLSQDSDSGVLNLSSIQLKKGSGNNGISIPAIEIRNGLLQIAEHKDDSYRVLKELSIRGRISNQTPNGDAVFEFVALPSEPSVSSSIRASRGSFGLTGTINKNGIDGTIDGLRLEDWPAEIVPSRSRGLYQRLALSGELAPTQVHVSNDGLVDVVLTLDGVSLTLPIDDTGSMPEAQVASRDLLRMRNTRGTIRFGTRGLGAKLKGLIDEIEYTVELDYKGFDAKSPFDAVLVTDFHLDNRFKPAKFLPEKVIEKLDRFENPIADVHAQVFIKRDAGADSSIKVSGRAELSNGSAIYKKFRYPIHNLAGIIEFDPDKLVIDNITGVGPTGAALVADGLFSPLGEDSVVRLEIVVTNVGIDEQLMRALDDDQKQLVQALFNNEDYANLLDSGLLLTNEDRQELGQLRRSVWDRLDRWNTQRDGDETDRIALAQELARIDSQLELPNFEFGGAANIEVVLVRHPQRPEDNRWSTDVHVTLPNAGLVPGNFPLPIVAQDVEIAINEQRVELTGGRYNGLRGGWATVNAKIDLTKKGSKPTVEIVARQFPIDDRLIAAIPGYYDQQSENLDDISLRRILDRLRLNGIMECDAIIGPRSDGQLGFDVESTILEGSARPMNPNLYAQSPLSISADPIALSNLYGTIYVTEELIIVDIDALLSSPDQPLAPTSIQVLTQLTLPTKRRGMGGVRRDRGLLPTDFGPPIPGPQLYATASADGIDLAMHLEHAVAVVSPRIARDLIKMKDLHQPDGVLGIDAQLEGIVGGAVNTTLTLNRIEELGFTLDDTRYQIGSSWGVAQFYLSSKPTMLFDGFRIPISADGHGAGVLSVDGTIPLARAGRYIEIHEPSKLTLEYLDGTLDSPITQGVMDQFSSAGNRNWLREHEIGGRFDLGITLSPKLGGHIIDGKDNAIAMIPTYIDGTLKPKSLSLQMGDKVAQFDQVSGEIRFNGFEGVFAEIRASDELTTLGVDGRWSLNPGEGLGLDLSIDAKGDLLKGPVRAILPDAIDGVIDRLEVQSTEPVEIKDLKVVASRLGKPDGKYHLEGGATLVNGSAVIGLPITGMMGEIGFVVEGTQSTLGYEIEIEATRLRAGLMRVYDAQVSIIGDANNVGVVLVPDIRAGMHGGQIAGSAQIRPGFDGKPNYWMELHASGVRAAPMFDDLLLPPEGLEGPPRPGQTSVLSAWSSSDDLSRGALIGDLTMTGPTDDPSRRSGRGIVQISGGSVVALPGLINLIEVSNLSLPVGSSLDLAEADFYVDGPILAFEQLSASSKRIEILGYGTLDWTTRVVDLRFRSRSVNPIPIVSGLLEQLRDELITTRVSGTIGHIKYSAEQFGSTKRLINAMLGNPLTDHQQRLYEVEQQVRANRNRTSRFAGDRVHLPIESLDRSWDWDLRDNGAAKVNKSNAKPAKNP